MGDKFPNKSILSFYWDLYIFVAALNSIFGAFCKSDSCFNCWTIITTEQIAKGESCNLSLVSVTILSVQKKESYRYSELFHHEPRTCN